MQISCTCFKERQIGITKNAFRNLSSVLRKRDILLESKKREVECYIISVSFYMSLNAGRRPYR